MKLKKQMKKISDNVAIPLAAGERIYWRWGYRPFLEDGSLSVIQPDICTCGGVSEVKKICDMAHIYDVTVQIHVCGGPISTAAAPKRSRTSALTASSETNTSPEAMTPSITFPAKASSRAAASKAAISRLSAA